MRFLILFLILAAQGWGATAYVDPSLGTDQTGCGSAVGASACASIEYAREGVAADDIVLCPGTYDGTSGVLKAGTDNAISSASGLTFRAQSGSVTIDLPAASTQLFGLRATNVFQGIYFTNSTGASAKLFGVASGATPFVVTFEDGGIDYNNAAGEFYGMELTNAAPYNATITFRRMVLKNWDKALTLHGFIRNNVDKGDDSTAATVVFEGCLLKNMGRLVIGSASKMKTRLAFKNNTVVSGVDYSLWNVGSEIDARSTVLLANNIFVGDATFKHPISVQNLAPDCSSGRCGPPTGWTIAGNIVYRSPDYSDPHSIHRLYDGANELVLPDESNYYIDPNFTDPTTDDYTPRNGLITGKGVAAHLLAGGDIAKNSWTGTADIGAFANPAPASPVVLGNNSFMFTGDSIAAGISLQMASDNWPPGWTIAGAGALCSTAGATCSSWGGSNGSIGNNLIDRAIAAFGVPEYFVVTTYHNNFVTGGYVPSNNTTTQAADDILTMAKRVTAWGSTPIILGMMPGVGATRADQLDEAQDFNAKLAVVCAANSLRCEFPAERIVFNPYFANSYTDATHPGYYTTDTLTVNVHPRNPEGYRAIGSTVEDALLGRSAYYLTQAGTPAIGSEYGTATLRYPISITGLNAQSTGASFDSLPTGVGNRSILASGTFTTALNTPAAGASGKKFMLSGGFWPTGNVVDQQYWEWNYSVINGVDGVGITTSAANAELYNLTINGVAVGVSHSADVAVKNVIFVGTTTDIQTTGGTLTASNNLAHTTDAMFRGISDLRLSAASPAINAGVDVGLTTDIEGKAIRGLPDIGAYEFQPRGGKHSRLFLLGVGR